LGESALKATRQSSDRYQSLNGQWKFNWSHTPESAPANLEAPDFAAADRKLITVPGNWKLKK